jgi:NADH-quinone oxidoreductase subunit C
MSPKPPATMQVTPWQDDLAERLAQRFGPAISEFSTYQGQKFLVVDMEAAHAVVAYLKSDEGFDYLVDLTAVDYPKREARFDLIYILYSFSRNERIRVKTLIKEGQKPQTVTDLHLTANWLEREAYDMFGIEFQGHPDLRRILMPDDWRGFPLRKDYSILNMDNRWVQENLGIESGQ